MINTKEALLKYIANNSGINVEIKETDNLEEDFGFDELDRVELTMSLEEEFNLLINDEEAEKFIIVKDIIDYLQTKNIELS